jgi:hypothetical protein
MNKIEVELIDVLLKLEQAVTVVISNYGSGNASSMNLSKELNNFKVCLFKLLASNAED